QREAPLADLGVVALRQVGAELMSSGQPGRPLALILRGVGLRKADVAAHGLGEEEGILEDDPYPLAQLAQLQLPQVAAAQQHPPAGTGRGWCTATAAARSGAARVC